MHKEQRALVRQARLALNLQCADALFRRARAIEREAPMTHRDWRSFHDRPDAHGELFRARAAPPQIAAIALARLAVAHHVRLSNDAALRTTRVDFCDPSALALHERNRRVLVRAREWK